MATATDTQQTTGLITQQAQQTGTMAVYDRVEPLQFIAEMGRAFAMASIAKNEAEGKVLALACLCERKNVFEIKRTYHLIEGNLSMRADAMLAKFRQAGGKCRWIKTGDDGLEAALELQYRDEPAYTISFSLAKAKAAGYVKSGSQWMKRADQMLRARCITDGVRMVAPEIIAGYYSEDELADVQAASTPAAPVRTAEEVEARRRELQQQAPQETIVDAVVEPVKSAAVTTPTTTLAPSKPADDVPFEVPGENDPANNSEEYKRECLMLEIEHVAGLAGTTPAAILVRIKSANPQVETFEQLSLPALEKLSENLKAKARERGVTV